MYNNKISLFLLQNQSESKDITGKSNTLRPSKSHFSINTNPCTVSPPFCFINFEAAARVPI